MPTLIPTARRKSPDVFCLFVVVLAATFLVLELVDPAPITAAAAAVASP